MGGGVIAREVRAVIQGFGVTFASHEDMPPEVDWLFLEVDKCVYLVIREGRDNAALLSDAWSAFREMVASQRIRQPQPAVA